MSAKTKKRASRSNRAGMAVIGVVVVLLIGALLAQSIQLKRKITSYQQSNASLEIQIQEEADRAEELKLLPDYVASDEYIEKAAREKFGLVYRDEILFKPTE